MDAEKILFENLPEAVMLILAEMKELKAIISTIKKPVNTERLPIGIEEAEKIVRKSKHTIYKLVSKKKIPCYKVGKKLYFFEDELIDWILNNKSETYASTIAEVGNMIAKNTRRRR